MPEDRLQVAAVVVRVAQVEPRARRRVVEKEVLRLRVGEAVVVRQLAVGIAARLLTQRQAQMHPWVSKRTT